VGGAARTKGRVSIEPVLPVDILGAYVLLKALSSMARRAHEFQTTHSEGGLLPPDLLRRLVEPREKVPGTRAEDYGLPAGDLWDSWLRTQLAAKLHAVEGTDPRTSTPFPLPPEIR
jgi:hypothetical protein